MDKIILKNLVVLGILGVLPDERVTPQPIVINLIAFADLSRAAVSDKLADTVDYAEMAARVKERVASGSDQLIERLAHDVAQLILTQFAVVRVIVRIEKPLAIDSAESVGIEIERNRHD